MSSQASAIVISSDSEESDFEVVSQNEESFTFTPTKRFRR